MSAVEGMLASLRGARDSAPLYLRLTRTIEDAVRDGLIGPGDALPSERDIAATADVSRVTVRKAVRDLVERGLLVQRHGSGTFVAKPVERVEQSLSRLTSFSEDMARRGLAVRSVWLERGVFPALPEEVMALGLSPGERPSAITSSGSAGKTPRSSHTERTVKPRRAMSSEKEESRTSDCSTRSTGFATKVPEP